VAEFKELCILLLRDRDRIMTALLGRSIICNGSEQIAAQAINRGFARPFAGRLDDLHSLIKAIQAFDWLLKLLR
jgi:hypothetical protein